MSIDKMDCILRFGCLRIPIRNENENENERYDIV
jgi:hypothetical protein